tara:strand:- start:946 stop:3843 length:2898 start_codon:yes stop_codon:yes gene_type:complete
MESYAGYRGTSPPNLFVSFNRDELDMDFAGASPYQDPLDLKNTFLSWEFGHETPNKGLGKLTLINPGTQIEDKLFSWYSALTPRSWTSQERAYTPEELNAKAEEVADFYIRWGYQSNPSHATILSPSDDEGKTTALSHIHKFRMLDMSYSITADGDKIIVIELVNAWALSYSETEFTMKERVFDFSLVNDKGEMRSPSIIIQEALLQLLAAHDQYKGYSKWTDEQFAMVDADFMAALKLKMPEEDVPKTIKLPNNAADLYVKYDVANATDSPPDKNWVILDTIKEWFGQFGLVPSFAAVFEGSENDPNPKKTSPNQGKGAPDQGPPDNPNLDAVTNAENAVAAADDFTEEVTIIDFALQDNNPLAMAMNVIAPGSPISMGAPPYTLVFKDEFGITKTRVTYKQIVEMEETREYFYAVHPALKSQVQDKPYTSSMKFLAWEGMFPAPDISLPGEEEEEDSLVSYELDTGGWFTGGDFVSASLKIAKDTLLARKQEKIDALHAAENLEEVQREQFEDLELLNAEGDDAAFVPPLAPRSHTVQLYATNLEYDLRNLLMHFNQKYFKSASRYLQAASLEFATVPKGARSDVEAALGAGFDGMSWEKDDGMLIITDSDHFSEIFAWANVKSSIKSFPIQSKTEGNTISIATGMTGSPNNIVTSLSWSMNNASIMHELRQTPMVIQKLYNVAKRFEDPKYRDVVMGTLALNLTQDSNNPSGELTDLSNGSTTAIPELENQQDAHGAAAFSDAVVKVAQAQAVTMTSYSKDSQDQADISEAATLSLAEQVQEDLRFISDEKLTDIFFPGVDPNAQDSIKMRFGIITPEGEEDVDSSRVVPFFRYISKSPITILQKSLEAEGLEASEENAVLVQAKVEALTTFKAQVTNVNITMLGVPEMDLWSNEIMNRSVALWVHEPRVPGTFHWVSGMYIIQQFSHKIDSSGYILTLKLAVKTPNTADEMSKYTFTQVGD